MLQSRSHHSPGQNRLLQVNLSKQIPVALRSYYVTFLYYLTEHPTRCLKNKSITLKIAMSMLFLVPTFQHVKASLSQLLQAKIAKETEKTRGTQPVRVQASAISADSHLSSENQVQWVIGSLLLVWGVWGGGGTDATYYGVHKGQRAPYLNFEQILSNEKILTASFMFRGQRDRRCTVNKWRKYLKKNRKTAFADTLFERAY